MRFFTLLTFFLKNLLEFYMSLFIIMPCWKGKMLYLAWISKCNYRQVGIEFFHKLFNDKNCFLTLKFLFVFFLFKYFLTWPKKLFAQKVLSDKIAAINLTARGPIYTYLVKVIVEDWAVPNSIKIKEKFIKESASVRLTWNL